MKRSLLFTRLPLGFGLLLADLFHAAAVSAQDVTPKDLEEQAEQFTQTAEMILRANGVKLSIRSFTHRRSEKRPVPVPSR